MRVIDSEWLEILPKRIITTAKKLEKRLFEIAKERERAFKLFLAVLKADEVKEPQSNPRPCPHCGRPPVPVPVMIPADLSHTGESYIAIKPIDACLADVVRRLNAGTTQPVTSGCCCGHGKSRGTILLHDGRILTVEESDGHETLLLGPSGPETCFGCLGSFGYDSGLDFRYCTLWGEIPSPAVVEKGELYRGELVIRAGGRPQSCPLRKGYRFYVGEDGWRGASDE